MKKIIICGVLWDTNLGDMMLMQCATELYRDALEDKHTIFEKADFYGRTEFASHTTKKEDKAFYKSKDWTIFDKIVQYSLALLYHLFKGINESITARIKYLRWKLDPNGYKRMYNYFEDKIKGANLVVFAGGGIIECSMQHDYYLQIDLIVKIAKRYSVPVVFNAVGIVNKYRYNDWRYLMMQKALNSDIVESITVRDDIDTMNKDYLLDNNKAGLVADSGVWVSEINNIKKNKDSDLVGLGLIRWNAFISYGIKITKDQLIDLYIDIILELESRGYKWRLFSNGLKMDQDLGVEIIKKLGRGNEFLMKRPESPKELIKTISNFKGIITCRLHACITAYSLDVPAVALSWNNKINQFMEIIEYPERAINILDTNATYIVNGFEYALNEGFDENKRKYYRDTIKNSIKNNINKI